MVNDMDDKIQNFLAWMQSNGASLRGCYLKNSSQGLEAGLGLYTTDCCSNDDVVLVTPLVLAITPMTVLQDPLVGPLFGKLFADGQVDDRHVMMLYLMVQHALGDSSFWAPYLKMLPTNFGTSVFFSEDEMLELEGTALYNATRIQKASLSRQFEEKVKLIVEMILESVNCPTRDVSLEDYLWANFIFWTRALTIPCPHSLVCPKAAPVPVSLLQQKKEMGDQLVNADRQSSDSSQNKTACEPLPVSRSSVKVPEEIAPKEDEAEEAKPGTDIPFSDSGVGDIKVDTQGLLTPADAEMDGQSEDHPPTMVEGLVPGIDFCNHAVQGQALARWEVDGPDGSVSGVPNSMYLVIGSGSVISPDTEITIYYGNKGNEELLYLYGFVLEDNPDEYLMVHFPVQALEKGECSEAKSQLLEHQELPLRWLLPRAILTEGYLNEQLNKESKNLENSLEAKPQFHGFSWSGDRKPPPGVKFQVFPEDMMGALRIIAMTEEQVLGVQQLLEELAESSKRFPTAEDVRAAVWEVCGDLGALQLLHDLLTSRVMAMEEGTGPGDEDTLLIEKHSRAQVEAERKQQLGSAYEGDEDFIKNNLLSKNKRACVVYRKAQKDLARQFLQEVEYALDRWIC
ncbi:hypothetical protein R1sor_004331 [Riccia sorocarpa]|uniref:SET domain-containing protein n=1 Tax=Riccia sorocarpa TaxID=122646 RepID=A0ABD3HKQ3_9MARC